MFTWFNFVEKKTTAKRAQNFTKRVKKKNTVHKNIFMSVGGDFGTFDVHFEDDDDNDDDDIVDYCSTWLLNANLYSNEKWNVCKFSHNNHHITMYFIFHVLKDVNFSILMRFLHSHTYMKCNQKSKNQMEISVLTSCIE